MNLDIRYTIPATVLLQSVDDETLLFNSSDGLFFALNEMGTVLWQKMSESDTLQELYDQMIEEYDVDEEQLARDIIAFAQTLREQRLLNFETKE